MTSDDILIDTEPRRRRPGRALVRTLILLLVVAGVGYAGWWGYRAVSGMLRQPVCRFAATSVEELDPEQAGNAALITAVATKRGLPPRASSIAIATALQESKLRNIKFGDRDSLGLFQQRPSQGWGTAEQILDAVYSTNKFFDALVKVTNWQTRDITEVAQAVQRSAFPEAYRKHEQTARTIASALTGQSRAATGCRLEPPRETTSAAAVATELSQQLGVTAALNGNTLTFTGGSVELQWQVGQWAVARADVYGVTTVSVGPSTWQRDNGDAALSWGESPGASTGSVSRPGGPVTITVGPAVG